MTKKQLEQRKVELEKELNNVKKKLSKLLETEMLPELKVKYNNTYWKYQDRGSFVYLHAKEIADLGLTFGNAICDTYYLDESEYTGIHIRLDRRISFSVLETKITKKEFDTAVSKIMAKIKEAVKC